MLSELEDDVKKMKCLQYVLLLLPEQNRMFLQVQTYLPLKNPLGFQRWKPYLHYQLISVHSNLIDCQIRSYQSINNLSWIQSQVWEYTRKIFDFESSWIIDCTVIINVIIT